MLSESHPLLRNFIRFLLLPYCFFKLVNWKQCTASRLKVAFDLLDLFFRYRCYPDHYSPCRFWEKSRDEWVLFYGSSYNPFQREKLRKVVQPFDGQLLFQDKNKCEEYFKNKGITMPACFGSIKPHENFKKKLNDCFAVEHRDRLILKPLFGSAGRGILLAVKKGNTITVKGKSGMYPAVDISIEEEYLVQEVISQHATVATLSPASVNTVRTVPLLTADNNVIILSASMRFGVGDSFIDNWSVGGVGVGVDCTNGTLMKYAYDKKGNRYTHHPVTAIRFEGFSIPFWEEICELTRKTQLVSPFYRLIGLDVAVTPNGPVAIEINANPDIIFQEQTGGPLFANSTNLKEFARYDLLYNKRQKQLLSKMT